MQVEQRQLEEEAGLWLHVEVPRSDYFNCCWFCLLFDITLLYFNCIQMSQPSSQHVLLCDGITVSPLYQVPLYIRTDKFY